MPCLSFACIVHLGYPVWDWIAAMIKFLLAVYIFCSVNDLILFAFNLVQLKNVLLILTFVAIALGSGKWQKKQASVFYTLTPLVMLPIMIGVISGVGIGNILQQTFAVVVAILVPVMVDRFAADDEIKWNYVSSVVMFSLVFMMLFKIVFVLFQMGFLASGILDLLFRNIAGRGEIDGVARFNTGTQLVMLYGLVLCISRLFAANLLQRMGYVLACLLFLVDLFIASSRFFTVVAPLAVVVTLIYGNIKVPRVVLMLFGVCIAVATLFLVQDMYSARVISEDGGDTIRQDQTVALFDSFKDAPVFGHGAGYSIPTLTRNDDAPFMYEVQVVAFLMQFGIVGALLFLVSIFQMVKLHVRGNSSVLVIFYFGIFFAASYYNPYMLGSYAGLCIVVVMMILRGLSASKRGVTA